MRSRLSWQRRTSRWCRTSITGKKECSATVAIKNLKYAVPVVVVKLSRLAEELSDGSPRIIAGTGGRCPVKGGPDALDGACHPVKTKPGNVRVADGFDGMK
ncbi:MAG: hypothetical protein JW395_0053 [Nitrospira sp.]|nr:hypothetical protein [Nitrospira sp.]